MVKGFSMLILSSLQNTPDLLGRIRPRTSPLKTGFSKNLAHDSDGFFSNVQSYVKKRHPAVLIAFNSQVCVGDDVIILKKIVRRKRENNAGNPSRALVDTHTTWDLRSVSLHLIIVPGFSFNPPLIP